MEFVVIWVLVGLFASREAIPDITAAFKGNTPPSHERRMRRLEARGVNTENDKEPGTLRAALRTTVKNAEERAALRREAKHAGKLQWLDENKDRISEESYNKIKARNERKQAVVSGFAKAKRLVTDAPERIREAKAYRRNRTEPGLLDRDWDTDDEVPTEAGTDTEPADETAGEQSSDGQYATVLEFKRVELSSSPDASAGDVDSDSDSDSSEGSDSSEQADLGEHMEQGAGQTAGENSTENADENTPTEKGTTMEQVEPSEQTVEPQPVPQPVQQLDEPSYETTGLTATLQRVQASARACHRQVGEYDRKLNALAEEHDALGTQVEGLETQIATLQERKNTGEQIRALQQAQERLGAAQAEVAEQITHARNGLATYEAAASSFDEAHTALAQQLPGQDFYAATADAGDKEFLTQG